MNSSQPLTEKEIVYLADKLVADNQIIPLQERLDKAVEGHRNEPEALRNIYQRFYRAHLIRCHMEEILGESIYAII